MGAFDSVKLGVCEIYLKADGATTFTELGLTSGGCEFKYSPKWKELMADQYGETPIDYVLIGEGVSVKVPLLETSKEKLKMAMPGATLTGGVLSLGSKPGKRASDNACVLVLHPISSGTSHSDDITLYQAINTGEASLNFAIDKEQVFECSFIGLIDKTKSDGSMLCSIGEDTLAPTP